MFYFTLLLPVQLDLSLLETKLYDLELFSSHFNQIYHFQYLKFFQFVIDDSCKWIQEMKSK